jgi:uncharacterized protein (TIGR03067 family)
MPRHALILLVLTLPAAADDKRPDPKADAAALKGIWEVVSSHFDGNEVPSTGRTLVFGEKEFTAYIADKKGRTLKFTLDAAANPKRIDLDKGGKDGKAYGIYALDKDELKICYGEPGAERPKAFESKAGDKKFLLVLKRVKVKG